MSHTNFSTVIGVDPGVTGGIAVWKNGQPVTAHPMPPTEGDLVELFRGLNDPGKTAAYVEAVGGYVGAEQPGARMFRFGRSYGFILGVLQVLNVRVELVRPQKWQKAFGLGTASLCASRSEWKSKLKAHAQRLHPGLKLTLKTADAALILDYALKAVGVRS